MATLSSIITPSNITTATNTQTLTNKTLTGAAMNGTVGATTPSTVAATTLSANTTNDVYGLKVNAADSRLRILGHLSGFGGALIDAVNTAENAHVPLLITANNLTIRDEATDVASFVGGHVGVVGQISAGQASITPLRALHLTRIGADESLSGIAFTDDNSGNYRSFITPNFSGGTAANNKLVFSVSDGTTTGTVDVFTATGAGKVLIGTTTAPTIAGVASGSSLVGAGGGDWTWSVQSTSASSNRGMVVNYSAAAPNDTGNEMLFCYDSGATRFAVRSNGGIANYQANDVNLSDERVKTAIIPVESYLDKMCAIEVVKFKYKDQTHDDYNLGVIAQQVETVAPEFVDADGFDPSRTDEVPLKAIYQTDLSYGILKAVQELAEENKALRARVFALEND